MRLHGQHQRTLMKNVGSISAHERSATRATEKRQVFLFHLIIFSYSSIFHSVRYRLIVPMACIDGGWCACAQKREWMCQRHCVNVLKKEERQRHVLGDAHNLISSAVCFISCLYCAQGCMQMCSLENKWYKSEIHPMQYINKCMETPAQIVCTKLVPLLCLFPFPHPLWWTDRNCPWPN